MPRRRIPQTLARYIRDRLTPTQHEQLRRIRDEYGMLEVVIPGDPPHPVQFREGTSIRNLMRESGICHDWSAHDLDDTWAAATEWALDAPEDPLPPLPTYKIVFRPVMDRPDTEEGIYCYRCGMTSYNPSDVKHRYCGYCHEWHECEQQR